MTVGEVAKLFGVTEATVRVWANAETLPSLRTLGGHRRFDRRVVMERLRASGR